MADEVKIGGAKRGRKPRAEQTQERRRRRNVKTMGKRLQVREDLLDFENFRYRWINAAAGVRIYNKTQQDDWDIVRQNGQVVKEDNQDLGDAVSHIVGVAADGSPERAYLCRKPRKWYEEDERQKQTELDEQLENLKRGKSAAGEDQGDYIPSGGIKIA